MSTSEFELIRSFFASATVQRPDVLLGIGDDCAVLQVPAGRSLAVSMDTLVEDRHFSSEVDPAALGHKALAVNLSDLAAVGADPAWATLSLTLPQPDVAWLGSFMQGFAALADRYGVQLVGGDLTRGPLSITLQLHGLVTPELVLRRSGGQAGDHLLVSGSLGDAALALCATQERPAANPGCAALRERLDRPTPRIALGRLLRGRASAAIDVSDGLLADLNHLCTASGVGARIELAELPLSAEVAARGKQGDWSCPLSGGDDYELLFSVPPARLDALLSDCRDAGEPVQVIGSLAAEPGIELRYPDGRLVKEVPRGFDHFQG